MTCVFLRFAFAIMGEWSVKWASASVSTLINQLPIILRPSLLKYNYVNLTNISSDTNIDISANKT